MSYLFEESLIYIEGDRQNNAIIVFFCIDIYAVPTMFIRRTKTRVGTQVRLVRSVRIKVRQRK